MIFIHINPGGSKNKVIKRC